MPILTPLLVVTMGLTVLCMSPGVELDPAEQRPARRRRGALAQGSVVVIAPYGSPVRLRWAGAGDLGGVHGARWLCGGRSISFSEKRCSSVKGSASS